MSNYDLQGNEWFTTKFDQRKSWVPAYFNDIPLSGLLRTTSRSESANSFFSRLIGWKLSLVEFWLRFDGALEEQRYKELEMDNVTLHTTRNLKTAWGIEKHGSEVFTHEVFDDFQAEVIAARDHCLIDTVQQDGEVKIAGIIEDSRRPRVVHFDRSTMVATCSCMLFETHGIPCRHIILALRSSKLNELPKYYLLERFMQGCKKTHMFDADGTLLEENTSRKNDPEMHKMLSEAFNLIEKVVLQAKQSPVAMRLLRDELVAVHEKLNFMVPGKERSQVEEFESYLGCSIPDKIDIHPPNDTRSRGRIKRIKGHHDEVEQKNKNKKKKKNGRIPRMCKACKQVVLHDSRNCPNKASEE
jgi:hypothetical protein